MNVTECSVTLLRPRFARAAIFRLPPHKLAFFMPSDSTTQKTLYLIDGHSQFFRAYHAIRTGMTSPVTQEPTNLTFGFVGMLLKVLREYKPDYLAVVIDVAG